MDAIVNWIQTIVAVMLFTILVELIIPEGKTKKYVQLVTGLLITVVILNPVIGMVQGKGNFGSLIAKNTNYMNLKEIEANTKLINQKQDNLIFESYKESIKQDVIKEIEKNKYNVVEIYIEVNNDKNNFGSITSLNVQLAKNEKKGGMVEPVKSIIIEETNNIETNQKSYQKDITLLKGILCEKYNIDSNNIQISIISL